MLAKDSDEDTTTFLQNKYQLRPNNDKSVFQSFDGKYRYHELHQAAKREYKGNTFPLEQKLEDHIALFRNHIDQNTIGKYSEYFKTSDENSRKFDEFLPLIERILSPEIDAAIKEYLGSEYGILWCTWYVAKHPDNETLYLNKWHCDAGPSAHLKTITYFDASSEHGSGTAVASLRATNALKEVGYVMNDIRTRQKDISDLTDHHDIDLQQEILQFDAGDTMVFNPTMRLHRVELPRGEEKRHAFSIGFVPSTVPWRELIQRGILPRTDYVPFETFAADVLRVAPPQPPTQQKEPKPMTVPNLAIVDTPEAAQTFPETISLDEAATINSAVSLLEHLNQIFKDQAFAEKIQKSILTSSGPVPNFTVKELITKLKASFQRELQWEGFFQKLDLQHVKSLLDYEERFLDTVNAYNLQNKPDPNAVMWPMPNHEKYPRSKFNMEPFVLQHKILDKTTPIASAGSCFAYEIAKRFQKEDFNYVVEERADDPSLGVFVDHYTAGDQYAPASAHYGILFNTPSLIQLAQKAFGLRSFPRYCAEISPGVYSDPYRENVYFNSVQAYELDYPKHIEAVRRVLTKSEVFVFTAGLNECWEMYDGSVISRNPKPSIQHLLKHKVLTVQENIDNLTGFIEIVRRYNPKMKLVISLSPVPLLATGRANTYHIIEANTHSKAVLRVAIDEVVKNVPNAYYLPSYEMVTECVEQPWTADHRHVTDDTVCKVINMFKKIFVEE